MRKSARIFRKNTRKSVQQALINFLLMKKMCGVAQPRSAKECFERRIIIDYGRGK